MSREQGVTIAIDGPAGAGKSTVARRVAQALGYTLVDTGAIYRAVALRARREGVGWEDDAALGRLVASLEIDFRLEGGRNQVLLAGEDVTDAIRAPEISMGASTVSARPIVREGLLELQRALAGRGGAVLEGRDIGTVVFPDAEVKIFLDASVQERARRRHAELDVRGEAPSIEALREEIARRDAQDAGRPIAPLRAAEDALVVDSTAMTIDQVVQLVVEAARNAEVTRAR